VSSRKPAARVAAAVQAPALPRVLLPLPVVRAPKLPALVRVAALEDEAAAPPKRLRQLPEPLLLWTSPVTGLPLLPKTGLNACLPIHRVPALSHVVAVDEAVVVAVQVAVVDEAAGKPRLLPLLLLRILVALMPPVAACAWRPA
jgi:hypothetical protein